MSVLIIERSLAIVNVQCKTMLQRVCSILLYISLGIFVS